MSKIYSIDVGHSVTDTRQFPVWVNQTKRDASVHRYWRDALPPGPLLETRNETYGVGSGVPVGMEQPLLVFERPMGSLPFVDVLLIHRGLWLVTEAAQSVFANTDREAFEFCEAITRLHDGSEGPKYWVCDVVRFLDAVDEAVSPVTVTVHPSVTTGASMRSVSYSLGADNVFKASVINGFHVFRALYAPGDVFCDEFAARAIERARLVGLHVSPRGEATG